MQSTTDFGYVFLIDLYKSNIIIEKDDNFSCSQLKFKVYCLICYKIEVKAYAILLSSSKSLHDGNSPLITTPKEFTSSYKQTR